MSVAYTQGEKKLETDSRGALLLLYETIETYVATDDGIDGLSLIRTDDRSRVTENSTVSPLPTGE